MNTLIFLNGDFPELYIIKKFLGKKSFVIAADGGANKLKKINIIPDLIIGDLDSVSKSTLVYFRKKGTLISEVNDQEKTDFEKSLIYCTENGKNPVKVFGSLSMRPDHTLNNFSILKRYIKKLDIKLITEEFEIFFMEKYFKFNYRTGEIVSMLAIPIAEKVTTTGLEYELKNENLEFGVREGALNRSTSGEITIRFRKGNLLLFRKHFLD